VVPSLADALFYICGPAPMMDAMRGLLRDEGVPASQIRMEVFQAATAIGARAGAPIAADGGEHVKVACTVSNVAFSVAPGVTLLDAAEAAGVRIPSLCRSGVCGTCRTKLVSGDVRCTSDALDEEDRANHYILPCVAWPSGDCALEA
jgi:ferredoxin